MQKPGVQPVPAAAQAKAAPETTEPRHEVTRVKRLPKPLYIIYLVFVSLGILLAIYQMFGLSIGDVVILQVGYYFLLMGLFLPCAFLIQPATRKLRKDRRIPLYDMVCAFLAFVIPMWFFTVAWEASFVGLIPPPVQYLIPAVILIILAVESGRRIAGNIYVGVALLFGLYPLFANYMPGILYGFGFSVTKVIGMVVFGTEGMLGIPSRVMGDLLIGFLLFAGVMIATGAGQFFLDVAMALAGRYRGGPAKVAVISSALFGTLSGSAMPNIVATGSVTIPAMKRLGFAPDYAGAVEAVASTGGHIVPPVMGGVVFVMCVFLNVDYGVAMIAAIIPAILYYFGLAMGVDAYAAKAGIKGMRRDALPSVTKALRTGWSFLFVLAFLVWGLAYERWGVRAPFYAAALLMVLSFTSRATMMTGPKFLATVASVGQLIAQAYAILLPMGFIINGLVTTGVTSSLTASAVNLAGGNVLLVLVVGFIACYVMGMAGLITPAYIFLAVTMAPVAVQIAGLNKLAVHFFIVYYTMLAPITLPVAGGAFVAATIADAPPIRTGWTSMRLAIVTYFIPFWFAFEPALLLQGNLWPLLWELPLAFLGTALIAAGAEGYLWRVGLVRLWQGVLLIIAGIMVAFPETVSSIVGAALAVLVVLVSLVAKRRKPRAGWSKAGEVVGDKGA